MKIVETILKEGELVKVNTTNTGLIFVFGAELFAYLHLCQYQWQGEGLRSQVADSGLGWAGETFHTLSSHIEHCLFISKWTAGGPWDGRGNANERNEQ